MLDVLSGRDRVYWGLCYSTHISSCLRCVVLSAKGCVESLTATRDMALVVRLKDLGIYHLTGHLC